MGMCVSCESASVATAKVILEDGRLQQYSYPIKVSILLSKDNPSTFICNSDDMEFDNVVTAVPDDEELQPGQLYFVLPLSKLRRPLQPEEMAALAVKANAALLKTADNCRCRKRASGVSFFGSGDQRSGKVVDGGVTMGMRNVNRSTSRNRNGINNGGRKKFNANLTVILE